MEAYHIFITGNTFSFREPRVFMAFRKTLGSLRVSQLRRLHLQLYSDAPCLEHAWHWDPADFDNLRDTGLESMWFPTSKGWEDTFNLPGVVTSLKRLHTLHVSVPIPYFSSIIEGTLICSLPTYVTLDV